MGKFKAGDKVKVVKNMAHYSSIEVGNIYEVDSVRGLGLWIKCSGIKLYLTFEEVELVEPKDPYEEFRNLPVGTKFVLRDDLVNENKYGEWWTEGGIMELKGLVLTISEVNTRGDLFYKVGSQEYISPEMIGRVIVEEIVEEEPKEHNHYFIDVTEFIDKDTGKCEVDVYVILEKFGVTSPCLQHVAKKALVTGKRGHKDYSRDLQDMVDTLEREKEINSKR